MASARVLVPWIPQAHNEKNVFHAGQQKAGNEAQASLPDKLFLLLSWLLLVAFSWSFFGTFITRFSRSSFAFFLLLLDHFDFSRSTSCGFRSSFLSFRHRSSHCEDQNILTKGFNAGRQGDFVEMN